jgi:secreted trypsin-like serine protease
VSIQGKIVKIAETMPVELGNNKQDAELWSLLLPDFGAIKADSNGENIFDTKLRRADLSYVAPSACAVAWASEGSVITDRMMCAMDRDQVACSGDSGGPLVLTKSGSKASEHVQVGIVSWGYKRCERSSFPGVYTKVPAVYSFIKPFLEK